MRSLSKRSGGYLGNPTEMQVKRTLHQQKKVILERIKFIELKFFRYFNTNMNLSAPHWHDIIFRYHDSSKCCAEWII